jgi:hypothetical protein
MSTSTAESKGPSAVRVRILDQAVVVDLSDGRTVAAPLAWYPRLLHGSVRERRNWRLIEGGEGIHWPDLDEDVNVEGLLAGRRSAESRASLKRWLAGRRRVRIRRSTRTSVRSHGARRRARG